MKSSHKTLHVVIADDHPVVLNGLKGLIETDPSFRVVAVCPDGRQAIQAIKELQPELAILDVSMPGLSGIEVLEHIQAHKLTTRVIFLTASAEDHEIAEAVTRGAYGLMLKDVAADTLLACMRAVVDGRRWLPSELVQSAIKREEERRDVSNRIADVLTSREREIVEFVAEGQSNKEIALRTGLTEGTVKIHLHNIYRKLNVGNRTALTALALSYKDRLLNTKEL